MKSLHIANTIITTKEQVLDLLKKLNRYFLEDKSIQTALVIDSYTEQLVNVGFLTWDEAESVF